MQPIKRYNMDACIVFSDILITPFASGSDVYFIEGKGPTIKFNENIKYNHKKTLPIATGIKNKTKHRHTTNWFYRWSMDGVILLSVREK